MQLADLDCAWLEKLTQDSQLDDLPSGILDSLVPEEPAPPARQAGSSHQHHSQQLQMHQQHLHMHRQSSAAGSDRPHSRDASRPAAQREGSVPMHMPVPEVMYVPQMQQMQWVPYSQYAAYPHHMHGYAPVPVHMAPHHMYAQHMPMHGARPSSGVHEPAPQAPPLQPAAYQQPRTPAQAQPAAPPPPPQQQQQQHGAPQVVFVRPDPTAEAVIDIESYVPRSLLPMDVGTRTAMLQSRRTKLERFREKKRKRSLKKTIRYASRKAYAEVRPRIKGRFARKDEVAAMRANGLLPVA